jgi:uncharacterized protein (TIGR00251 family)
MKISVTAKPKSKEEKIEKIGECEFKVSVKEPPIGGRANWAITRVLAEYFKVSPSRVTIVSGATSRHKIVEID